MVASLRRENGVLKVDIDGKLYEPLSFKSFRPTERNISEFAEAGVKLFTLLVSGLKCHYEVPYSIYGETWFGKGKYDFTPIDEQIELFMKSAPGCYYAVMIHLDTRDWWHETHENFPRSFTHLSQAIADPEWRAATIDYLKAVVRHIEEQYGECIYGYFMLCGKGTEWFCYQDFQASHPIKEKYFKEYTGNPDAQIPSKERLNLPADVSFYDDDEVVLYQRAHAELIADTILLFAKEVQTIINHKKLLGLYFGYLFEFQNFVNDAGHLAYEKIFHSKDINMISSPASYGFREPDSTSAFMLTFKSLDANDKLYFYEYDQRTYLSQDFALEGAGYYCKTDREAVDLMRRDFMLCTSNNSALWWFDMFEGWYRSDAMMGAISDMIKITDRISAFPRKSCAEVAVIGSPEAMYGANKNNNIHDLLLFSQREGYMRLGAPFDLYSEGDMSKIDFSQYKLVVFLIPFALKTENFERVEKLKKEGKTLLWMYAPDYLNGGIDKMKKITDLEIEVMNERPSVKTGEILPSPYFFINDKDAVSIVDYDCGKMALGYKKCKDYISVYSAIGLLDAKVLREICRVAGVHIYSDTDPVYVSDRLVGVYSFVDTVLNVREDGVYEELFTGEKYEAVGGKLFVPADEYASKLFMKEE